MSWKANFVRDERNPNVGVATAIYVDDVTQEEYSASYTIKYPDGINEFLSQAKQLIEQIVAKKKTTSTINAALADALTAAFGDKLS